MAGNSPAIFDVQTTGRAGLVNGLEVIEDFAVYGPAAARGAALRRKEAPLSLVYHRRPLAQARDLVAARLQILRAVAGEREIIARPVHFGGLPKHEKYQHVAVASSKFKVML